MFMKISLTLVIGLAWILRTSILACSLGRGISILRSSLKRKGDLLNQTQDFKDFLQKDNTCQDAAEQGPGYQVDWSPWSFSPGWGFNNGIWNQGHIFTCPRTSNPSIWFSNSIKVLWISLKSIFISKTVQASFKISKTSVLFSGPAL